MRLIRKNVLFLVCGVLTLVSAAAGQTLTSGSYRLSFPNQGNEHYGTRIQSSNENTKDAYSAQPIQIFVCTACTDETTDQPAIGASYSSVTAGSEDEVVANAVVSSANGSVFQVSDRYQAGSIPGTFTLNRTVTVVKANSGDVGFNSQFVIGFDKPTSINQYHFLAPGIWYDKNANVIPGAFASNYANNYFYWRETRSGLPFVMMQDPDTGAALSIAHIDSTPSSGADETNQVWLVNSSIQYGSIGAQRVPQMQLGFIYPADEGDGNYVGNRSTLWVRRSHPVQAGFSQNYSLLLSLQHYSDNNGHADFGTALAQTWRLYYKVFHPPVIPVPSKAVFSDGISLLDHYSANRNGAQGFPFSSLLPDGSVPSSQISYLMGFVGEQIPAGYQMVRAGFLNGDASKLSKGIATIDFWAHNAAQPSGLPLTWYNVVPPNFRDDDCSFPIFLRTASDGMEGVLAAAVFMRQHGQPQPDWETFAQGYGDWLAANQNADGSFYRAYNPDGTVFTNTAPGCDTNGFGTSKFDTTHPIRFLVSLYFATGKKQYLQTAVAAGRYSYGTTFQPNQYVGGTPDNGDTIDKEAGVEALHAALALYDATHKQRWLEAARAAANFTETWMYAWNFPITNAPPAYVYAGTQGSSLIATGQSGSDIFLSFEAYDFYRLHLFGDDSDNHYLQIAQYLENNTKLTTQVTGVPQQQFGYALDGLVGEANDLSFMAYQGGNSAGSWLPWLTEAEIEPLQRLADTFGSSSIQENQQQPAPVLKKENRHVYPTAGSIGWGTGLGLANPGFELPGISTNSIPGWRVYTPDNGASADAAFTETFGQSHNGSWHLAEYKPTPYTLSVYQDVAVPNGTYTVTAWVECSGGQADAHMEIHNNLTPDTFSRVPGCLSATQYQPISLTVPVTTGKMTIGFYSYDPQGGHWLRVDDVSIIANPGFETPGYVISPPPGWSVDRDNHGQFAADAYTETFGGSHSGNWHLTEYASSPYKVAAFQDLLVSNGPHTVTAWTECSGGQSAAVMEVGDAANKAMRTSIPACLTSTAYQQISGTVMVTSGKLRVSFFSRDPSGNHWLRVDDVTVK